MALTKSPPRLLYGYISASSAPINIVLPWQPSVNDGLFKMNVSPEDAERDNLIFWAQTNWGEIPYNFRFGLDAARYLFDPIDLLKTNILRNAQAQLSKYFKHLKILKMRVLTHDEDDSLSENSIAFYLLAETRKGSKIEIKEILGNRN